MREDINISEQWEGGDVDYGYEKKLVGDEVCARLRMISDVIIKEFGEGWLVRECADKIKQVLRLVFSEYLVGREWSESLSGELVCFYGATSGPNRHSYMLPARMLEHLEERSDCLGFKDEIKKSARLLFLCNDNLHSLLLDNEYFRGTKRMGCKKLCFLLIREVWRLYRLRVILRITSCGGMDLQRGFSKIEELGVICIPGGLGIGDYTPHSWRLTKIKSAVHTVRFSVGARLAEYDRKFMGASGLLVDGQGTSRRPRTSQSHKGLVRRKVQSRGRFVYWAGVALSIIRDVGQGNMPCLVTLGDLLRCQEAVLNRSGVRQLRLTTTEVLVDRRKACQTDRSDLGFILLCLEASHDRGFRTDAEKIEFIAEICILSRLPVKAVVRSDVQKEIIENAIDTRGIKGFSTITTLDVDRVCKLGASASLVVCIENSESHILSVCSRRQIVLLRKRSEKWTASWRIVAAEEEGIVTLQKYGVDIVEISNGCPSRLGEIENAIRELNQCSAR